MFEKILVYLLNIDFYIIPGDAYRITGKPSFSYPGVVNLFCESILYNQ